MAPPAPPAPPVPYTCFNVHGYLDGHFYSAVEFYKHGVWVGYFSPEKHGERFRGLPSFNELKSNCKRLTPPYPPPVSGKARDKRAAVCRGCCGDKSKVITLEEIPFAPRNVSWSYNELKKSSR